MSNKKKNKNKASKKNSNVKNTETRKAVVISIVVLTALLIVIVGLCIGLSYCEKDREYEDEIYSFSDLQYILPENFEETNYGYGEELEYSDGKGAYFFFNSYDAEEMMEDQGQAPDISVQEYAQICITVWNVNSKPVYDKERDAVTFEYYIENANEYYRHLVIRGSEKLFLFTLSCDADDVEKYREEFDKIFNSINPL